MALVHTQSPPTSSKIETIRHLANFSPCIYGDLFTSFTFDNLRFETYAKEIEGIKEEVGRMLLDQTTKYVDKMKIIDSLCRLGISYLFPKEIDDQLQKILELGNLKEDDHDLYTIAVHFRVFRQHGYSISCNVFEKFLDERGKFGEFLVSDTKGILSLYEASQLRLRGEDILEEAFSFTTTHLKQLQVTNSITSVLKKQVTRALEQAFHKGIPRVESRIYISMYEDDKLIRNDLILKLAKQDFNMIQQLHQHELFIISKWWNDLEIRSKLPYCRDRVAECYLFVYAMYFEPCFSSARIMLTKIELLVTVLDDTYDAYGTIEELQVLTDAIDRWDISCINNLPDNMKFLYGVLLNLFDEVSEELTEDGKSFGLYYTIEAMKELCRSYLCQAKWFNEGYIPTMEEYTNIAYGTSTVYVLAVAGYMAMGDEIATKETIEWIKGRPKILKSTEAIGRLCNDIAGSDVEQKRGHVASSVECYMNEFGVSRTIAIEALEEIIRNEWKILNEEFIEPSSSVEIPKTILNRLVNIARYVDVVYKKVDGFTNPQVLKDCITLVFLKSLCPSY